MKERRSKRRKVSALAAGAAGVAAAYFFDPQMGRTRRAKARDRIAAMVRRAGRRLGRKGRWLEGKAYGLRMKATHPVEQPKDFDDATLAHKVESEVLRGADVPKGKVAVNAEEGIVALRGEVETVDQMNALVESVMRTPGVEGVENYLHLPGEVPPNKARSLEASEAAKHST